MSKDPTDEALLAQWRGGRDQAGNDLLVRHFRTVYEFFLRRVPPDEAEDLVQWTFEAMVKARQSVPEDVRFRAYLLGIARNQLLMHLRRKRGRAQAVELPSDTPATTFRPSQLVARRDEQRRMIAALQTLPLRDQLALELHYWEGLNTREMGVALGVGRDTAKTRLRRARDALRAALERVTGEPMADVPVRTMESWIRSLQAKL